MSTNRNFLDHVLLDRDWLLFLAIVGICIALASARLTEALI